MNQMKNMLRVLKVEPGKEPYVKEIPNTLKSSQQEVEGYIELVYLENDCIAVVNEEGKIRNMEPNRRIGDDIICGPFFICGDGPEGEFVSLTDEQIRSCFDQFSKIIKFTGEEPELVPMMVFISL